MLQYVGIVTNKYFILICIKIAAIKMLNTATS